MNRLILAFGIVVFGLNGCDTTSTSDSKITSIKPSLSLSQEETWKLLVGKWYGNQPTKDGGKKEEIAEKQPDGTYKITFRIYDPEKGLKERVEIGQWGVSGNIYFTIYRGSLKGKIISPSDPSDPYNYDAYRIINLSNEVFEYEHVTTGNKYIIKKVSPDFEFKN